MKVSILHFRYTSVTMCEFNSPKFLDDRCRPQANGKNFLKSNQTARLAFFRVYCQSSYIISITASKLKWSLLILLIFFIARTFP
jgi:hypothetical protein